MQPTAAVATVQSMLSFIVPAYNEELELPSTIASIRVAAQDRSARGRIGRGEQYEIVVVEMLRLTRLRESRGTQA